MKRLAEIVVMVLLVFLTVFVVGVAVVVLAQTPSSYILVQKESGYMPPTLVIPASTPATVQICAAFEKALVSCRSVGEFREWVKVREAIQQQRK